MAVDKLIVTNRSALKRKYGNAGFTKIETAVKALIKADAKKGMNSRIVYLDDATLRSYGATPVRHDTNQKENKVAIDKLYSHFHPDYLLILGSRDVVPHIKLVNLTNDEDGRLIDSDLPYACDKGHSQNGKDFLAPTRVVGRLPDITGGKDPSYLVQVIRNAIAAVPLPGEKYKDYFALSAKEWNGSTAASVINMFNDISCLQFSPRASGPYKAELQARVHFFNCHGARRDHQFFGQHGKQYPVAYSSSFIDRKLRPGTFVAAECCYGAELYDVPQGGRMSISNTYLFRNAAAYVGSTTVAYGPADGQGSADLITQYFVVNVLKGYSVGRAFLEARQKFIAVSGPRFDAVEMKTIKQFLLLGDPSVHLVLTHREELVLENGKLKKKAVSAIKSVRTDRRKRLKENGLTMGSISAAPKKKARSSVKSTQFAGVLKQLKFGEHSAAVFGFSGRHKNEEHYCFTEKTGAQKAAHHSRILVFKKTGNEVIVRVYHRK